MAALALIASVVVTIAAACSSASGPVAGTSARDISVAPPTEVVPPIPLPVSTPAPQQQPGVDPLVQVSPPTSVPAATGTPIPPRRGRTPTPTPVYRPPEPRGEGGGGLVINSENVVDLFDPFQPEGDREIGAGQYRPGVPRDSITPVYVPRIRMPDELQIQLTPEELVLGVEIDGEARAYPIGLMRFREMANDTLGGVPILVSW